MTRQELEHLIRAAAIAHGLVSRDTLDMRLAATPLDEARRGVIAARIERDFREAAPGE